MHEFSIVQNLFDIIMDIAEREKLTSIQKVTLLVGKMQQVVPDSMQFAFEASAKDTLADNATLEIEMVPIKMRCNECQDVFIVEDNEYICQKCYSGNLTCLDGKEIIIKSIDGDKK